MTNFLNHNGRLIKPGTAIITADNRGFRYGDGLFETMKVINGHISMAGAHYERLYAGMLLMEFEVPAYFTAAYFTGEVQQLCKKNGHEKLARVRSMIFRGNGGLYDPENLLPNYVIQSWELPATKNGLNENGLVLDLYEKTRKAIDEFSGLKSNNFLPYVMAALHAKKHRLNDCLLLNTNGAICETTIANVFIVKKNKVFTPPLSEGCVAGVVRRYILENLKNCGIQYEECSLPVDDLLTADELFLTNAVQGIRWVQQFRTVKYSNAIVTKIHQALFKEIL